MNQKHILFPCPGIFQLPSLPQNFPLLPTSPPSYLPPPSYLRHLISHSLHLQSSRELLSLSSTKLRQDVDTRLEEGAELNVELRRDVNTRLEEGGELNIEGMWKGESKRSASSQVQKQEKKGKLVPFFTFFFLLYGFSFLFFCLRRGKLPPFFTFFFLLYGFFFFVFFFLLFEKKMSRKNT